MTDAEQHALRLAIGKAFDRFAKKHPHVGLPDMCATLGVVAGVAVGTTVPAGYPEMDIELGNLIGIGYAEGVSATRKARAS